MDRVRRAEPTLSVAMPDFPAAAPVQRVEFIEFATSPDDAPGVEDFLSATGFSRAGAHVSKSVTLWRQGGVNVLVNTDSTGFAHSSYVAVA
jgi:4-hydroxyphenylpyruvate dioxygenase